MIRDLSKRQRVEVACSCGQVEWVERWVLVDEAARAETVAELAQEMPNPGFCSKCGAHLPYQDFFAVLRHCDAGPVCFIFSIRPNIPGVTRDELLGETETVRTIQLPFQAAPVLLSRQLSKDLVAPSAAATEVGEAFGPAASEHYARLLQELTSVEHDKHWAELLEQLSAIENAEQFQEILDRQPELLSDELLDYLARISAVEDFRTSIEILMRLLREARSDPTTAWQHYESTLASTEPAGERIEEAVERLEHMIKEERWEETIALGSSTLKEAQGMGLGMVAGILHSQLGIALLQNMAGDRRNDLEHAIEHLERASQLAPSGKIRASQMVNLAAAFGQRLDGDPNENFEEALRLLERAAEQIHPDQEPWQWATLQTNLCRSLQVRESGEKLANLERALQHAYAALEARSPDTNADDWALSQINLGVTLQLLAEQGARDLSEAKTAYEQVLRERNRLKAWMVVQALAALAELDRIEARSCEDSGDPAGQITSLSSAVETLREGLELIDPQEHRLLYGRLLNHLSDSLDKLGQRQPATKACEEALDLLTPQSAPVECQQVATRLGGLFAESDEWEKAADAYRTALAAADITYHSRLHIRGRQNEMRRQGNLARWASYAAARSGDAREAVEILEGGRARELQRRIYGEDVDTADLEGLPDSLRDRFVSVTTALNSVALGDDSSGAARAFQEVLAEIRRQPGYESFGKSLSWEEISGATEPNCPLIYLNPTPGGTVLFCLQNEEDGEVTIEPIFRSTPRGTDVPAAMLFGGDIQGGSGHSYIGTACGLTPDRDLGIALETLLPWLGEEFGRPISDYLRKVGAAGATLVPCGIIGIAPIHIGLWEENNEKKSLIEQFDIRYAASASMQKVAMARRLKAQTDDPHLVALGNPVGADLEAAEGEVREIAGIFGGSGANTVTGHGATSDFLLENAAEATHLHLACHASGAAVDLAQSAIVLTDRGVTAAELAAVGPLRARLTVASACQTAISDIGDLPEEALSIGTALIGAGSACVIASLWSVDDYATALLMTRLYEELANDRDPVVALRSAQLWLAELNTAEEAEYLEAHPYLKSAFLKRDLHRHPARWRNTAPHLGMAANRYSHPVFWAPFVAVGA